MYVITTISQALLYLCVAICIGYFILSFIKKSDQPKITVPFGVLVMAIVGIAIFSFIPVLKTVLFLSPRIGMSDAFQSVLFTFEIGKAWLLTFIMCFITCLFIYLIDEKRIPYYGQCGLILSIMIILTLGWSSHASSIDRIWGFIGDSLHLLAVSVWIGILFIVSWFSKNSTHWLKFLRWYTPVAIICLFVTVLSGILLMNFMVDWDIYTKSWLIPYGQALLWKHLMIIPLFIYAFINGIFIRRRLKTSPTFNPRPWAKIESIVILLIFTATAMLGEQPPPKEADFNEDSFSSLFLAVYQGPVYSGMDVFLDLNKISFSLFILGILFLVLIIFSYFRKVPPIFSFLMSILFVINAYLALMYSIQ